MEKGKSGTGKEGNGNRESRVEMRECGTVGNLVYMGKSKSGTAWGNGKWKWEIERGTKECGGLGNLEWGGRNLSETVTGEKRVRS